VLTERCAEVCQSVYRLETDDIGVSSGYETAINSVPLAGKASARLATSFPPRCLYSINSTCQNPLLYLNKGRVLDLLNRCMPRIRILVHVKGLRVVVYCTDYLQRIVSS
jgi:hypothetical protein